MGTDVGGGDQSEDLQGQHGRRVSAEEDRSRRRCNCSVRRPATTER
jgi:hypothetical protein